MPRRRKPDPAAALLDACESALAWLGRTGAIDSAPPELCAKLRAAVALWRGEHAPPAPRWLTAGRVAGLFGVCRDTVRDWAEAGRLRGVRLPDRGGRKGNWRFRPADVAAFAAREGMEGVCVEA